MASLRASGRRPAALDRWRGECDLYATDVMPVQADIAHRDLFLSPAERRAGASWSACVARSCAGEGSTPGSAALALDSTFRP